MKIYKTDIWLNVWYYVHFCIFVIKNMSEYMNKFIFLQKQTLFFSRFYRYQVIWKIIEIIYKVVESLIHAMRKIALNAIAKSNTLIQ